MERFCERHAGPATRFGELSFLPKIGIKAGRGT
jgi:hypothetical protein